MLNRNLLLATAFALSATAALAQTAPSAIATPSLRADVAVSSDLVRIGDVLDHAGPAADIAIYRAPDPGTSGSLAVPALLAALRAHQVIAVNTRGLREISITRRARMIEAAEIERAVSQALAHRNGLGEAASLSLTFDRELQTQQIDSGLTGTPTPVSVRVDQRGRFDVTLEIAGDAGAPMRLRLTGSAVETVEATMLTRTVERGETIKSADISIVRRPRAEIGGDAAPRDQSLGMQARKQLRSGQPLRGADLVKPDLVQRDQSVTLIYETAGVYLTMRGKAVDGGAEGDVVTVMNLASKRTVSGTVTGRGQVTIAAVAVRAAVAAAVTPPASAAVALAAADFPISRNAE